jgi:glucosylceramidase
VKDVSVSTRRASVLVVAAMLTGACDISPGEKGSGGSAGSNGSSSGGVPAGALVITSAQGAYWKTGTLTATSDTADMTVSDTTTHQRWDGFGGAFNEKGWDNLSLLDPADRNKAMALLFDEHDGANFVYGRIPIGCNDYSIIRYTDDDTPGDTSLSHFSITRDMQYLVPYVKAAMTVSSKIHFWASPWTPPPWMKDNDSYDGGNMQDIPQNLQTYALYLTKWIQAYQRLGITIEVIMPQNEPNWLETYPTCGWTPALFTKFVSSYLGPTLATQKVATQIYLGTMSNGAATADPAIMNAVIADPAAMAYVKGGACQYGMMSGTSTMEAAHLTTWQSEHQAGNGPWETGFDANMAPNDYAYGVESWGLIRDWIKAGVNAYFAWNMVLDTVGLGNDTSRIWPQNSLLTVDRAKKTLNITPAYYVFRHFSQYVKPGATRVETTGTTLDALAFKNPDGSHVAIMYNSGSAAMKTTFAIGDAKLQFSVPAGGWATLLN